MINLFQVAYKNLLRKKSRSGLTIVGIALAAWVLPGCAKKDIRQELQGIWADSHDITAARTVLFIDSGGVAFNPCSFPKAREFRLSGDSMIWGDNYSRFKLSNDKLFIIEYVVRHGLSSGQAVQDIYRRTRVENATLYKWLPRETNNNVDVDSIVIDCNTMGMMSKYAFHAVLHDSLLTFSGRLAGDLEGTYSGIVNDEYLGHVKTALRTTAFLPDTLQDATVGGFDSPYYFIALYYSNSRKVLYYDSAPSRYIVLHHRLFNLPYHSTLKLTGAMTDHMPFYQREFRRLKYHPFELDTKPRRHHIIPEQSP